MEEDAIFDEGAFEEGVEVGEYAEDEENVTMEPTEAPEEEGDTSPDTEFE